MSLVDNLKPLYPFYWCLKFTISSHCILSTDVFGSPSQAIVSFLLMSGSPSQAIVSFLLMSLVDNLKPLYPFYWCLVHNLKPLHPFFWCLQFTISCLCCISTDVFSSPYHAIASFLLMSLVHHLKQLYPFYWCLVYHLKPLYPFYWCLWFTISSHCILSTDVFGSQS